MLCVIVLYLLNLGDCDSAGFIGTLKVLERSSKVSESLQHPAHSLFDSRSGKIHQEENRAIEKEQHLGSFPRGDVPQTDHLPHYPDINVQGVANVRPVRKWQQAAGGPRLVCFFVCLTIHRQ